MTVIELVNLALLKIGHSKGITSLTNATREAWTAQQNYDHMLRATLRHFPWSFATKYAALYQTQGPVESVNELVQAWSATATYLPGDLVVSGGVHYWSILEGVNHVPPNATYWTTTETEKANGDWRYAYRWPEDCLFARRLVNPNGIGREYDYNPPKFRIGRDKNGLLIFTDEVDPELEYTTIDCTKLFADDLFIDAFTWRLAATLAPSLSKESELATKCYGMYLATLDTAAAVSSREWQQPKHGDADWISARNGPLNPVDPFER